MTFQEAQAAFSGIVGGITVGMKQAEILQKQNDLLSLMDSLPPTAEFNPIADAIADLAPKLQGKMTQAVLDSLRSREGVLKDTASFLDDVAGKANADARMLTFEQPKLVLATLTESITALQDAKSKAQAKNFEGAASQIEAVMVLIEQVKGSIKTA